eukprot:SAG22_NODE_23406_length_150_cov_97.470588_1_plen_30_part_10
MWYGANDDVKQLLWCMGDNSVRVGFSDFQR